MRVFSRASTQSSCQIPLADKEDESVHAGQDVFRMGSGRGGDLGVLRHCDLVNISLLWVLVG